MIDDLAKDNLHGRFRSVRQAIGTNAPGLVKRLATGEARNLGEIFDRPLSESLPRWQGADGSDLRVTPGVEARP
ncbi:hypothetical protein ACLQ20_29455 [Micromonospora sp. DT46]|uniref:hypothetical protein n=1 Tax=unclassified Micromonospora TaxID=2617518 RepID=UPI0033CE62AC